MPSSRRRREMDLRAGLEQVALPDSVREVIGARVGRLGKAAERVLSMAAVIGQDFDLDVLARATRTTAESTARHPRSCISRGSGAANRLVHRVSTPLPTHSSSARWPRTSVQTDGHGRTDRWLKRWRTFAVTVRALGLGGVGSSLAQRHPAHRRRREPSATPTVLATPLWPP